MIEKLAKVESAGLNYTDRGILKMNIFVQYEEGCHQNICNLVLDSYSPELESRYGSETGCELIRKTLEVFCIDDVHKLQGIYLWVIGEGEGLMFQPTGFRPLDVDRGCRKGRIDYKEIFKWSE